jgi:hypothetical protein
MNRQKIIKLARKAGFAIDSLWMTYPSLALPDLLERFADLVAAEKDNKIQELENMILELQERME